MLQQTGLQQRTLCSSVLCSPVCLLRRPTGQPAGLVPLAVLLTPTRTVVAAHTCTPRSQQRCSHIARITPFDQAWGTQIDGQSLASQLFAASLFPYLGFLFHLTRSGQAPRLTLFGFYFLLAFVGATIPAGIYAKTHYGTSLANVDWLHGSAESLLTVTNLFIVLGLRQAIRQAEAKNAAAEAAAAADVQSVAAAADSIGNGNGAGGPSSSAAAAKEEEEIAEAAAKADKN
eukprot:GHUV01004693.1.p1 GENE.GHUV01004693.1~~GHUV01004693.1.p1  ORF type:complete len:231 (+),score=70.57 GHUV01004693.1:362-1054(+)